MDQIHWKLAGLRDGETIVQLEIYIRAHQWFLISNLIEQGLDNIKKDPKILVPSYLVQNPLIAGVVKF